MKQLRRLRSWVLVCLSMVGANAAFAQPGQGGDGPPPAFVAGGQMVRGTVIAVAADRLTVKNEAGESFQVVITPNTRLRKGRDPVKLADVHAGDGIGAMGVVDVPAKTVHAVMIGVVDAAEIAKARENMGKTYIAGKVTAIDLDALKMTVLREDGVSQTIGLDDDTSFKRGGRAVNAMAFEGLGGMGGGYGGGQRGQGGPGHGPGSGSRRREHHTGGCEGGGCDRRAGIAQGRRVHSQGAAGGESSASGRAAQTAGWGWLGRSGIESGGNRRGAQGMRMKQGERWGPRGLGSWMLVAALALGWVRGMAQDAAPAPAAQTTAGGTIHGTVKAGTVPLPGVAVTATNTLTGKKYATTTDINGAYAMTIPRTGRYVVKAELAAFAAATQEVRIAADAADQVAEFGLELASRAAAQETAAAAATTGRASQLAQGLQSLNMTGDAGVEAATAGGGDSGAQTPSLGNLGGDGSGESIAVNGQQGQTNQLGGMSEDEVRQRIQQVMQQAQQGGAPNDMMSAVAGMLGQFMGGGPGGGGPGGGGGGRGGRGGGGAFRGFNPTQPHGAIFWTGGNNALNAAPFSIGSRPVTNPAGYQNSFGVSLTGTPYIPGLFKADPKQFVFLNVTGTRNVTAVVFNDTVPTLAERAGNFSAAGTTIYDPKTGLPFGNDTIPTCANAVAGASCLSPAALALLNAYYPLPNVQSLGTNGDNYQAVTTAGSNSTQASLRYVRNFGATPQLGQRRQQNGPATLRQNINFNGSYSHTASDSRNFVPILGGGTTSTGYNIGAGYTIGYGRLTNNASVTWNRSNSMARNIYTNGNVNPETILGPNALPSSVTGNRFYNGLPLISITGGFSSLNESDPSQTIGQTISFSDFVSYNHKRHNMRFGVDIRRVHSDSIGGSNVLGTLTFSGYATQNPASASCVSNGATTCQTGTTTGSGLADFLLGLPQQSSIQALVQKTYLRENVYDAYAQDDWRVRGGVTLNYGLRYEYFGPYTEKNNHLVNLDHNASFSVVDPVMPGQTGLFGGAYNRSLVQPDKTMFSPRFGFAYRVPNKFLKTLTDQMVVRGGYGVNFNTGQPASFARQLAAQPPFALVQTNTVPTSTSTGTTGCVGQSATTTANLTLSNAFGCSTVPATNSYAVNKNYRLGHVQVYNLGVQKTLPLQTVLNIDYNGSFGGDLDVVRAPNRDANGVIDPSAEIFNYEDSQAYSRLYALAVNLRKRMQKGVSIQGTYQYGHSIDDASSIGQGNATVAQDDRNLNAEEGNSSFLTRHKLTGNWVIELPFGPNRALLTSGNAWSKIFDGFNVSGNYTFASGTYYTPHYSGTVDEIASGASGSLRPNRNFGVPVRGPGHLIRGGLPCSASYNSCWFNPAAFSAPAVGAYGNASRGDIEGPGTVSISSSLSRTFTFGGTRSFEARMNASNVFNTVQYSSIDTTVNSVTYGQVLGAAGRRSLSFVGRYRF
jgi:hypothetical protein